MNIDKLRAGRLIFLGFAALSFIWWFLDAFVVSLRGSGPVFDWSIIVPSILCFLLSLVASIGYFSSTAIGWRKIVDYGLGALIVGISGLIVIAVGKSVYIQVHLPTSYRTVTWVQVVNYRNSCQIVSQTLDQVRDYEYFTLKDGEKIQTKAHDGKAEISALLDLRRDLPLNCSPLPKLIKDI